VELNVSKIIEEVTRRNVSITPSSLSIFSKFLVDLKLDIANNIDEKYSDHMKDILDNTELLSKLGYHFHYIVESENFMEIRNFNIIFNYSKMEISNIIPLCFLYFMKDVFPDISTMNYNIILKKSFNYDYDWELIVFNFYNFLKCISSLKLM